MERGNVTFFYMLFAAFQFRLILSSPLFFPSLHSLSSKRKQPNKTTILNSLIHHQDIICFLYVVYQITALTADGIGIWKYDSLTGIKKYKQTNK